jgi:two-component system LytT family response regulator
MSPAQAPLRVFLVDDEPLAIRRLARLLDQTGRVEIVGSATDPEAAIEQVLKHSVDVLFLDIEMPGLNGFEMLARLDWQPIVIFTTAYDRYALRAFEVNSVDYLLKPIEAEHLDRALKKIERLGGAGSRPALGLIFEQLAASLRQNTAEYPDRVASRLGDRVQLIEITRITHFYSKDKLTYAATAEKDYVVDWSISELEQRLDPKRFVRIHRSTLVNLDYTDELHSWFAGGVVVRLKDERRTELAVARDRVRALKQRLGI